MVLADRAGVDRLLKRHFWIFNLVVIAICSGFAGRAVAHLIESDYLVVDEAPRRHHAFAPPPRPQHDKDPAAIVTRDIFCSGCAPPPPSKDDAPQQADQEPQKSSLPLQLLGTLLTPDEASARAVIRELSSPHKDAALFLRGDPLFSTGATLDRILPRRVYLRVGGRREYLDLDDAPPPAAHPAAPPPRWVAPSTPLSADVKQGVSCDGGHCEVARTLVDKLLQNTTMLATSARFVPSIRNGKPNGFRLYAIRPGSIFAAIGLQNGDTIRAINGNDMSTPDQALALYSKLRNASHLSVELERRGATTTMDYTIR